MGTCADKGYVVTGYGLLFHSRQRLARHTSVADATQLVRMFGNVVLLGDRVVTAGDLPRAPIVTRFDRLFV